METSGQVSYLPYLTMAQVLFNPDKTDMTDVIHACLGNVWAISDRYKVSQETVYQYLNRNPEMKAVIKEARDKRPDTFMNIAEFVIVQNMLSYKDNPAVAQRAVEKVLDMRGASEGWVKDQVADDANQAALEDHFKRVESQLDSLSVKRNIDDSQTSNVK